MFSIELLHLQDHAGAIMHSVFGLGLYSGLNVSQYITEAVGLLNVQAGY